MPCICGGVTIWEEIEEARKNGAYRMGAVGLLEVVPGLDRIAPVTDFPELEDRAREAMEEYLSTRPTKVGDGLERRACGAVLLYLLSYSHAQYQEKCTEQHISQAFGAPRPRIKRLLQRMAWDGVVESLGIGLSSPFRIVNLGKAMKEGQKRLFIRIDSQTEVNVERALKELKRVLVELMTEVAERGALDAMRYGKLQ